MFPFLVDSEAGVQINETANITAHLRSVAASLNHQRDTDTDSGEAAAALLETRRLYEHWPLVLNHATAVMSSMIRPLPYHGVMRSENNSAAKQRKPLELWGFEGSPSCRLVREALCTLEVEHVQRSAAPGSGNRVWQLLPSRAVASLANKAPEELLWLVDENGDGAGFESSSAAESVDYLFRTYSLAGPRYLYS